MNGMTLPDAAQALHPPIPRRELARRLKVRELAAPTFNYRMTRGQLGRTGMPRRLRQHEQELRDVVNGYAIVNPAHACSYCGNKYATEDAAREHVLAWHGGSQSALPMFTTRELLRELETRALINRDKPGGQWLEDQILGIAATLGDGYLDAHRTWPT